jgi:endogenous inhibitor of DNA gyrase (YacG/DUF329 family)
MTCPTCKKPSRKEGNKLFPFCSERCQLVDLGRWLDEEYRVPDSEPPPPLPEPESNDS